MPFALFIYYSYFGMILFDQARQLLVLSIVFYSIPYLCRKNYHEYFKYIIIASLIHFTALIGFIFPVLKFKKSKVYSMKKWIYLVLWIASPLLMTPFIQIMLLIMPSSYSHYLVDNTFGGLGFGLVLTLIPILLPILLFKKHLKDPVSDFLVRIALLSYPLRYAGYFSFFLMRLHYYSSIFSVLIIPLAVYNMNTKLKKRRALAVTFVIYAGYFIVNYICLDAGGVLPYRTFFME